MRWEFYSSDCKIRHLRRIVHVLRAKKREKISMAFYLFNQTECGKQIVLCSFGILAVDSLLEFCLNLESVLEKNSFL